MVARPNFFLIGAPKCGTTSLAGWLRQHPNVYVPPKEIHFFNTDHRYPGRITMKEYQRLFEGVSNDHSAIGVKSVWYLASRDAVPSILEYNPESKFIACVRNPVEMAPALHNHQVYNANEDILDFKAAWDAQAGRERGAPVLAAERQHLFYGSLCKLGGQVDRLISLAGAKQVHIAFLDDMRQDPQSFYGGVLRFLELPPHQPKFRKANEAKMRRSMLVRQMVRRAGRLKRALRVAHSFGMLDRLNKWNQRPRQWQIDAEMIGELGNYFEDDIALLEKITGLDLTHWRQAPRNRQTG